MQCRLCQHELTHTMIDLGTMPLANSYLKKEQCSGEPSYPLHVHICDNCFLAQVPELASAKDIFSDYAYASSYSSSWLAHCKDYVEGAIERFNLGKEHHVVEIASNDGALLQYFLPYGISIQGIEPAKNIAEIAEQKGIPTSNSFFGKSTAEYLEKADLIVANNVLAHVPDIHDFTAGLSVILKPEGTITLEFPHLISLIEGCQFDTIYHEHFSYLSLISVTRLLAMHGLRIYDLEHLSSHGGSYRFYVCHESSGYKPTQAVERQRKREVDFGLNRLETYQKFSQQAEEMRARLLAMLDKCHADGLTVAAYGAPAKGNTLLNYCGITHEHIAFTVDRNPQKQGCYLPGSHIPIYAPEHLIETNVDVLLLLPWNLKDEITTQLAEQGWHGNIIVPTSNPIWIESESAA